MLQNAYFLAKIGADTAENERNFADRPSCRGLDRGGHRGLDVVEADAQDPAACERIRAAKGYPTSGAIVPAIAIS